MRKTKVESEPSDYIIQFELFHYERSIGDGGAVYSGRNEREALAAFWEQMKADGKQDGIDIENCYVKIESCERVLCVIETMPETNETELNK